MQFGFQKNNFGCLETVFMFSQFIFQHDMTNRHAIFLQVLSHFSWQLVGPIQ